MANTESLADQIDRLAKYLMKHNLVIAEGGAVDVAIAVIEKYRPQAA